MISVTEVRLIFFQWAKANPAAINRKTGMTGASGVKISIATKRFGVVHSEASKMRLSVSPSSIMVPRS
jgi:hypothetical protein